MALSSYTHPGIRDGEVGLRNLSGSDILDRIALVLRAGIEVAASKDFTDLFSSTTPLGLLSLAA